LKKQYIAGLDREIAGTARESVLTASAVRNETPGGGSAPSTSNANQQVHLGKTLEILSYVENYNKWIYNVLSEYIGWNVLEVGCGVGNITQFLINRHQVTAIDLDESFCQKTRDQYGSQTEDVLMMNILGPRFEELKCAPFDTVLCINLLEHIRDHSLALENMFKLIRRGGNLVLFIPAMRWLYGSLDRQFRHYRRYERAALTRLLMENGASRVYSRYLNILGAFGWFVYGRIFKVKQIPSKEVGIFDKIVPFATKIEKKFRLPFGQSLLVVAEKL
jgi:SAM-dependent methyltransferase